MSARLRLTLSYAGFLLLAAVAFFVVLLYIIRFVPDGYVEVPTYSPNRSDLLEALWPRALQVFAVLAVIGLVGGWLLAGRMLRPLQRINGVARRVSDGSLDDRVRLDGPRDEFRELADTFDSMLDRLQGSLDEQRRFAANAAHELRTPYAIERSMLDVALADPAGIDLARLLLRLDETNRRGIEVVGALLALASLDDPAGLVRDPVDVAEIVSGVVDELRPAATAAGLTIDSEIGEGDIDGSATLVRQLVGNLVINGIRHNLPGGWVTVRTSTGPRGTVQLEVANSGGVVSPSLLGTLTEPFVRGAGRVARAPGTGSAPEGSGLGLALVARIAEVHGAVLRLEAPPTGGLVAHVVFPAPR